MKFRVTKNEIVTFSWELMDTRSMFKTVDIERQHHKLNKIAELLDAGTLKTTLTTTLDGFSVENLKEAHRIQETVKTICKTVIRF